MRNCINCGAPLESEVNKCPYCNTSYFDISAVDLNDDDPVYIKLKINGTVITTLARVSPDVSITCYSDSVDITGRNGCVINRIRTNSHAEINLTLQCVPDKKIFTVKK